jgi:alkanesulfonate monooxygenase SsuD/methylene tetrahydromethanopterin reductase-like flavin-dependent oxidoreductase (luciferase family)
LPPEAVAASLPKLFIDRSLGRLEVPRLLRAAGLDVVTLAEHYGMPADEAVDDVTWIAEVAAQGWVALASWTVSER